MTSETEILVYSAGRGRPLNYSRPYAWYEALPQVKKNKFVIMGLWEDRETLMAQYYEHGLQSFTRPQPKVEEPPKAEPVIANRELQTEPEEEKLTMAQMRELCIENGYPKEEWEGFKGKSGVKKMEEYLNSK